MVIGNDKLHGAEAAIAHPGQKVAPAALTLTVYQLDCQYRASALPVDADGDLDRLGPDDSLLAYLFVAGIKDQVGIVGLQWALGEFSQIDI